MSDAAYAAFASALRDGGLPQRRPAFIANTLAIGLLFAVGTALFSASSGRRAR